jgi:RNA polymerase sigma-70 factor, ECF subfamily
MSGPVHDTDDVLVNRAATCPPLPAAAAPRADEHRFTAMFQEHFGFVWRQLRRLGVPPAAIDDAAQEVFMVAQRRLAIIELGKEKAFLAGTAVRVASDARRRVSRRPEDSDDHLGGLSDHTPGADELIDQKRARELLDRVVAELPEDARAVFVLYELEGMTMAAIATSLALPPGTVASRLRRAREVFHESIARLQAPRRHHG